MIAEPTMPPEIQSLVPLFARSREQTRRTLVEFYESDWEAISALKEQMDLSWKEFLRAIAVLMRTFQGNQMAIDQIAKILQPEVKK